MVDIADPTCAVSQTNRIATSCPLPPLCGFVIRRVDNVRISCNSNDGFHVIPSQLLICIVAAPPGNINHCLCSSL